jgi:hypothetical protein
MNDNINMDSTFSRVSIRLFFNCGVSTLETTIVDCQRNKNNKFDTTFVDCQRNKNNMFDMTWSSSYWRRSSTGSFSEVKSTLLATFCFTCNSHLSCCRTPWVFFLSFIRYCCLFIYFYGRNYFAGSRSTGQSLVL